MPEILLPPYLYPDEERVTPIDDGTTAFPPQFARGMVQRQQYAEPRLGVRQVYRGLSQSDRSNLYSLMNELRGRFNSLRVRIGYSLRGNFPTTELLSNPTFENGTSSWTAGTGYSITVADRVARLTRTTSGTTDFLTQAVSNAVQYAPYVYRVMVNSGKGSNVAISPQVINLSRSGDLSELAPGLLYISGVALSTSLTVGLHDLSSPVIAGDYVSIPYESLTRCALVDNGPNALLQSDELDTSWATSQVTVDDQAISAPDGTATADAIIEDSTNNTHYISQAVTVSSAEADYAFSVAFQAGGRNFAVLQLTEATGGHLGRAWFDLASGLAGTTGSTGANITNVRAYTTSLGNAWTLCTVVVRKVNAATTLTAFIALANADNVTTYTGDGTSRVYAWRATLAQSSVPTRLVQTTTTATSGTSQTGSAINIKGLPVSTNGLLLPGDPIEINGELKIVTAKLDSDGVGLGYLQFSPALVRSPADNDPIIVNNPMGKFIVSDAPNWENRLGRYGELELQLEHIYE